MDFKEKWIRATNGGISNKLHAHVYSNSTGHPFRFIITECMDVIPKGNYTDILCIGAGDGFEANYLIEKHGCNVNAISINPEEKIKASAVYPKVNYHTMDAHDLQFADNQFDVITMRDSFEHMLAPFLVLDECFRVLKPGGIIMIGLPNDLWQDYEEHLIIPNELQMKHLLNIAGFKLLNILTKTFPRECALTETIYLAQKV